MNYFFNNKNVYLMFNKFVFYLTKLYLKDVSITKRIDNFYWNASAIRRMQDTRITSYGERLKVIYVSVVYQQRQLRHFSQAGQLPSYTLEVFVSRYLDICSRDAVDTV